MQRIERTARLDAAPDEVFAFIADLENLPQWQSGVVEARAEGDGELRVGATATVTRDVMGQRVTAPLTITDLEPSRRLGIRSEVGGVKAAGTLDLAPADGGRATDLTFAMEIRASGLAAFMEPMIAGTARGEVDASLDRLQRRFASSDQS